MLKTSIEEINAINPLLLPLVKNKFGIDLECFLDLEPKNISKQLCWRCKYASDINACKWARYCYITTGFQQPSKAVILSRTYKGTKLDEQKNIIECPKFIHDGKIYMREDYAKSLGLTMEELNSRLRKVYCFLRYKIKKIKREQEKSKSISNNF